MITWTCDICLKRVDFTQAVCDQVFGDVHAEIPDGWLLTNDAHGRDIVLCPGCPPPARLFELTKEE